eukprot:CAMPEP_0206631294 /NCGR_PEP_ID=MMETSP0325_2-20121206/68113_1 /ASSEMBLY_ACC=CAM_ASM_000347 /TAXON_ID=2866 /ORGANISM="Crypthecodinium cohnii, Strain Seligo" /LENGTH=46 /DNA_ID= /DNA_START= /DNA_END= /DNA_ORIENTATION=
MVDHFRLKAHRAKDRGHFGDVDHWLQVATIVHSGRLTRVLGVCKLK